MNSNTIQIQQALEQILSSKYFANAQRPTDFLRYIVEKSLNGDEHRIKAYTIGVDIFGRDDDFDPQTDNIVRINAGRARKKLAEYYAANANASVKIVIPPRCYTPQFVVNVDAKVQSKVSFNAIREEPETPEVLVDSQPQLIEQPRNILKGYLLVAATLLMSLVGLLAFTNLPNSQEQQLMAQHLETYQQMLLDERHINISAIHANIALILMEQKEYQQAKWHIEQSLIRNDVNGQEQLVVVQR